MLFATGDVLAQQAVDRKGLEKHDFARTGRMAFYGGGKLALSIPQIYYSPRPFIVVYLHARIG